MPSNVLTPIKRVTTLLLISLAILSTLLINCSQIAHCQDISVGNNEEVISSNISSLDGVDGAGQVADQLDISDEGATIPPRDGNSNSTDSNNIVTYMATANQTSDILSQIFAAFNINQADQNNEGGSSIESSNANQTSDFNHTTAVDNDSNNVDNTNFESPLDGLAPSDNNASIEAPSNSSIAFPLVDSNISDQLLSDYDESNITLNNTDGNVETIDEGFLASVTNTSSMADLVEHAEEARQKELHKQSLLDSIYISWRDNNDHEVALVDEGKVLSEFSCSATTLSSSLAIIGPSFASTDLEIRAARPPPPPPKNDDKNQTKGWGSSLNPLDWARTTDHDGPNDFELDPFGLDPFTTNEQFQIDLDSIAIDILPVTAPSPNRRQLQFDDADRVIIEEANESVDEVVVSGDEGAMMKVSTQIIQSYVWDDENDLRIIRLIFSCQQEGDARIKMTMKLRDYEDELICISFIKRCAATWGGLRVDEVETGSIVFDGGRLSPDWDASQLSPPSTSNVDTEPPSFRLSFPMKKGNLRIKDIVLESSQPQILQPVLRGNIATDVQHPIQINPGDDLRVDLGYQCPNDHFYDQSLTQDQPIQITMSLINQQPLIPPLNFTWYGDCSRGSLPSLSVVSSPCKKSSTYGSSSTTFTRDPVIVWENQNLTNEFQKGSERPFSVSSQESCTMFTFMVTPTDADFELDNNGPVLPQLNPRPTISFDTGVVYVPGYTPDVKRSSSTVEVRVPYTCFNDGISPFHLTVTFKGVPSYDIYWRKTCTTPTVRDGTEVSAASFPIFGVAIVGALSVGLCCTSRGKSLLRKLNPKSQSSREEREILRA